MNRTLTTSLLTAGACLALASPASATWYGSDLVADHQPSSLGCAEYPCTLAQGHYANDGRADFSGPGVITQWRVKLTPGAVATLRILKGNDGYRAVETGPGATGDGGVTEVNTQIPIESGQFLPGIELDDGAVATDQLAGTDGPKALVFHGTLNPISYSSVDEVVDHELLSQVRVEPDADADGLGDETQDDCVGDCHATPGSQLEDPTTPATPGPQTGSLPGGAIGSAPRGEDPYAKRLARRPAIRLTVPGRAFYDVSSSPTIHAYYANDGRYPLKGHVKLLYHGKALKNHVGSGRFELEVDADGSLPFAASHTLARELKRKGKAKATLVADVTASNGSHATVKRTVVIVARGATTAFDGSYKGSGGLKLTVSKGFVTAIRRDVNTFCPGSGRFVIRTFAQADGFPAAVSRSGAFKLRGDFGKDTVSYEGTLSRRGTGSGKLSLFHTELTFGDGLGIDQCFARSDWKVKRDGR